MPYQVRFTDYTNPAKPAKIVDDYTLNTQTSLTFVGKNYAGYAPVIAENFLHLLENFANSSEPLNPVEGQLWYDNTPGVNILKVYDGTQWVSASSVKKQSSQPSTSASIKGDLWVDTENQQLYLYTGSNWLLIGPQYSSGAQTGTVVETITDTANVDHSVVSLYSAGYRIAIVSKSVFFPKTVIPGFASIKQGINLSTLDSGTNTPEKFWGTASQADALVVNGTAVASSSFLRADQTSTSNYQFNVRSSNGISIGSNLSFSLTTDSLTSSAYLTSKSSGSSISFRLTNGTTQNTTLRLTADGKVGIGVNNTSPSATLDVLGTVASSGKLTINDTTDATLSTASLLTAGGLTVSKTSNLKGAVNTYGIVSVNLLDNQGNPIAGTAISPATTTASGLYDIGTATKKFRTVYANTFSGAFTGTLTGSVVGDVSGSAAKLASATRFSIGDNGALKSDVVSNVVSFDGQGDDPVIFTAQVTQDFIANKTEATDSFASDQLLIFRTGAGLYRQTKQTLVSNIPTVPVGAIMPYAGSTPPQGYVLCDGSEYLVTDFPSLFNIIGYTYKSPALLVGSNTFAVPDLRGRFPLGRDNMDNGNTVPSKDNPAIQVDAGGGSANRVSDPIADSVGSGSGSENTVLTVENLPDHQHSLATTTADYWAGGSPGAFTDPDAVYGNGLPDTSTGYGVNKTGSVISSTHSTPVNTMNPYLTINYIIFTGVI